MEMDKVVPKTLVLEMSIDPEKVSLVVLYTNGQWHHIGDFREIYFRPGILHFGRYFEDVEFTAQMAR